VDFSTGATAPSSSGLLALRIARFFKQRVEDLFSIIYEK
jgi:DNA-binding XRE family transcriptional regulator